jgi:hypothetical protein
MHGLNVASWSGSRVTDTQVLENERPAPAGQHAAIASLVSAPVTCLTLLEWLPLLGIQRCGVTSHPCRASEPLAQPPLLEIIFVQSYLAACGG